MNSGNGGYIYTYRGGVGFLRLRAEDLFEAFFSVREVNVKCFEWTKRGGCMVMV